VVKVLWLDTETTGLQDYKHDIIQLAYAVEINEKIVESGNLLIQPHRPENIDPSAMAIHGRSTEQVCCAPHLPIKEAHRQLTEVLAMYCNKFDKSDKFHMGGFNVLFDEGFLKAFFKNCGDTYYGSWFNYRKIDALQLAWMCEYRRLIQSVDFKLSTLCSLFNIDLTAHDAMSDILASRELFNRLIHLLGSDADRI